MVKFKVISDMLRRANAAESLYLSIIGASDFRDSRNHKNVTFFLLFSLTSLIREGVLIGQILRLANISFKVL